MKLHNNAQFINYYESKNFTKSYQFRTDNLDCLFRFIFNDFRGNVKIQRIMIKDLRRVSCLQLNKGRTKKYLIMIKSALTRHRYAIFIENGYNYTDS